MNDGRTIHDDDFTSLQSLYLATPLPDPSAAWGDIREVRRPDHPSEQDCVAFLAAVSPPSLARGHPAAPSSSSNEFSHPPTLSDFHSDSEGASAVHPDEAKKATNRNPGAELQNWLHKKKGTSANLLVGRQRFSRAQLMKLKPLMLPTSLNALVDHGLQRTSEATGSSEHQLFSARQVGEEENFARNMEIPRDKLSERKNCEAPLPSEYDAVISAVASGQRSVEVSHGTRPLASRLAVTDDSSCGSRSRRLQYTRSELLHLRRGANSFCSHAAVSAAGLAKNGLLSNDELRCNIASDAAVDEQYTSVACRGANPSQLIGRPCSEKQTYSQEALVTHRHCSVVNLKTNSGFQSIGTKRKQYSKSWLLSYIGSLGNMPCPSVLRGRSFQKTDFAFSAFNLKQNVSKSKEGFRSSDVTFSGAESSTTFEDLQLPSQLLAGLNRCGLTKPSPVQVQGIPVARLGVDLVAQAKSGTGKTVAFGVVALESIRNMRDGAQSIGVLVLVPTRDLATQVRQVLCNLGKEMMPSSDIALFIGGLSVRNDEQNLRRKIPKIAVGTPGRVEDLVVRGMLPVSALHLFVLDEADRLLDGSFNESVACISRFLPSRKQVLAFSATYSELLLSNLSRIMRSPRYVNLCNNDFPDLESSSEFETASAFPSNLLRTGANRNAGVVLHSVRQAAVLINALDMTKQHQTLSAKKSRHLIHILKTCTFGQAVVFSNDKHWGRVLRLNIEEAGYIAVYMSGSEPQVSRASAMEAMQDGKARVLVSTDLTSRGVDFPGCDLVVHLDVPCDIATYLHRVGRAGRYGTLGLSVILYGAGNESRAVEYLERKLQLRFERSPALNYSTDVDVSTIVDGTSIVSVDISSGQSNIEYITSCRKSDDTNSSADTSQLTKEGMSNSGTSLHEADATATCKTEGSSASQNSILAGGRTSSVSLSADPGSKANCVGMCESSFPQPVYAGERSASVATTSSPDSWTEYAKWAYERGRQDGFRQGHGFAQRIIARLGPEDFARSLSSR